MNDNNFILIFYCVIAMSILTGFEVVNLGNRIEVLEQQQTLVKECSNE